MINMETPPFNGDLPLEEASTLPSLWYLSPEIYRHELAQVFGQNWIWAGRSEQVRNPGSWFATWIGEESVVVTRSSDGRLHAFSNVCRHRAARICRNSHGESSRLRCQYHGWTYDLEGKLRTTPEFDGVSGFNKEENSLPSFFAAEWGPWIFVCLSKNPQEFLNSWKPFSEMSQDYCLDHMRFERRLEYSLNCNWKVFVDNYLDGGYHINTLHPSLAGVIPYSEYRSQIFQKASVQWAPLKNNEVTGVSQVRQGSAQYWWFYPNLMINLYEGLMDVNVVIPEGPNRCRVLFDFYFSESKVNNEAFRENSIKVAHQVQMEDQEICEEVQKGLESRFFSAGRFSVQREGTGYHFHQILAKEISK